MKLFIWEGDGVLTDHIDGMICALAPDLESALKAIERACNYCMNSFPTHKPSEIIEIGPTNAVPKAWVCYGGG